MNASRKQEPLKSRGAANKILSLSAQKKQKGVITFSTGNHGKAGVPVEVEEKDTIAGGIGVDNQFTLQMVKKLVDKHLVISEDEIKDGIRYLFEKHRLIVEGAGVIGVSAILGNKIDVKGKNVVPISNTEGLIICFGL